jgi:hypothetical protein
MSTVRPVAKARNRNQPKAAALPPSEPTPDVAAYDPVSLSDHFLNCQIQIGHRFVHSEHHLLITLRVGRFAARSIVVIKVGGHIFVNHRGIPLVDEILEMAPNNCFI